MPRARGAGGGARHRRRAPGECTVALDGDTIAGTRSLAGMQPAVSMDEYFEAGARLPARCRLPGGAGPARDRGRRRSSWCTSSRGRWAASRTAAAADGALPGVAALLARRRQPLRAGRSGGLVAVVDLTEMRVRAGRRPRRAAGARRRLRTTATAAATATATTCARSRSRSPRAPASRCTAASCAGRGGGCGSASRTARASCCTRSATSEDGELRPICHRASIAELVIPYGDPNPTVHFKNVFDIGEYGVGPLVNALELGCDCLGEITYLDAACVDSRGERGTCCQTRSASTRRTTASSGSTTTTTPAAPTSRDRGGW